MKPLSLSRERAFPEMPHGLRYVHLSPKDLGEPGPGEGTVGGEDHLSW